MRLQEKLQILRKQNGYSQEGLANKLGVARQTVGKWENGQAIPELQGLVLLSELYGVTIDRLVKEEDECAGILFEEAGRNREDVLAFLVRAKKKTYAGKGRETKASRRASHDFEYQEKDWLYYDTYLGSESFSGEEAVWWKEVPVWSMNYTGRVIGENFSGDFLKEALTQVSYDMPYRGPCIYRKGDYHYYCRVEGEFDWYRGYEEIFYGDKRIYECRFHGGSVR